MMDSTTKTYYAAPEPEGFPTRDSSFLPPPPPLPPAPAPAKYCSQLRGSGSYPSMIRARTANRYKITKRTSDSMIITGHHHHHHHHHNTSLSSTGTVGMAGAAGVISEGNTRSVSSKKKKLLNNKKTVYSRASRRKSLENLGLLVRNRCGTAKLQWPSEKKETDVFDLLPEGCMQVRQLIRLKSRGGTAARVASREQLGAGDFYRTSRRGGYRKVRGDENDNYNYCDNEEDECNETEGSKESLANEAGRFQGSRIGGSGSGGGSRTKTDWKNRRNISVIVRIRPKQDKELVEKSIVFRTDSKTIVFDPKEKAKDFYFQGVKQLTRNDFGRKRPNRNISFQYDKVYGADATNKEIFEEMLKDLTDHLIEGYNSTVFAYGATGSGKTFTMIGSNSNPGITVLMVESLYKRLDELASDYDCEVVCSYLEVYNETIKDLLRPEKELSIREDGKKGIIISELSFYKPRGPQELLKLLRSGNRARTQHATDLNAESSRSHAVFEVKLCLKRKENCQQKGKSERRKKYQEQTGNIKSDDEDDDDGEDDDDCEGIDDGKQDKINKVEVIQSKLVMVDLAGSERGTAASSSTHGGIFTDGARQREGASINKSLLALASCISALADGKCHVPYRNSKLTRLLKDSLNGLCTTVMIANISPSALTSEDTYNTLKYADRAKSIVGPVAKQKNVFMEDLMVGDCSKARMLEIQEKNVQLQEQLEEEKLKRELILKELQELQRKNVEMKSEAGQEDKNVLLENSRMKGKERRKSVTVGAGDGGGGDEPFVQHHPARDLDDDDDGKEKECCFSGKNEFPCLTEDQLPNEIQQYIEIVQERARIFSEYVRFASQTRFSEWATACKKLKADMADFLGRLPVEDENYISFSKLKNEVNNCTSPFRNRSAAAALSANNENDHNRQTRYALKLKNLTEKLELVRRNFSTENNLLLDGRNESKNRGQLSTSPKMVAVTLDQFLEYKRLVSEQEGNEGVDLFHQQFCQQINNQVMTSGMTLMNALKTVKSVYLQLRQVEESTLAAGTRVKGIISPELQREYKELLQFVYGPGPPATATLAISQEELENNNNNISGNVKTDNLLQPLSSPLPPEILPQMSNLGRKSSPVMDDLASIRKLVERPLLIQLTSLMGATGEETEEDDERYDIKMANAPLGLVQKSPLGEDETLDYSQQAQEKQLLNRSNSTFSCFTTSTTGNKTATRKSLSTSHTIYEVPQPTPATRVRGGEESSPEFQLPSHNTCSKEEGEAEDDGDEEETRYNDEDDGKDNDHHYPHPPVADNDENDDDDSTHSPTNGTFQVETLLTADESSSKETFLSTGMRNSLWSTLTTNKNTDNSNFTKLVNPVRRKNSTSFEIIFDKKEEKRRRGGRQVEISKASKYPVRVSENTSTHFGSTAAISALSRHKISENHLNNESERLNDEWRTCGSSSCTESTSGENVVAMLGGKKNDIDGHGFRSAQQKKSIGNSERLADQAFIKDCHQHQLHHQHLHPQQIKMVVEGNVRSDNKIGERKHEEEKGNPSSYIYQLDSPTSSSTDILVGFGSNKKGFGGNADGAKGTSTKLKSLSLKSNKMKVEKESDEAKANKLKVRVANSISNHLQNLNPLGRRGHVKQRQDDNEVPKAAGKAMPDIGSSKFSKQKSFTNASRNKNTGGVGGGGGKGLNLLLSSPPAGAGLITGTTSSEFPMNVQGQSKKQRIEQYKVTSLKKSIALHPSKASTDLLGKNSMEKVGDTSSCLGQKSRSSNYHATQVKQQEKQNENDILEDFEEEVMTGHCSGGEESEWEVRSGCSKFSNNGKIINMPSTMDKSKQVVSSHSLLSSARSTMSHQKAPFHTNCKTFTVSRESLPTANMPIISCSLASGGSKLSPDRLVETLYVRQQHGGKLEANYYSSNEDEEGDLDCYNQNSHHQSRREEYDNNYGNFTGVSDDDNGNDGGRGMSCYSDDCNLQFN